MFFNRLYIFVFAIACVSACYANTIEATAEAVSIDICDARDFATAEAKAKLEVKFEPVLKAIVEEYASRCGDYTIPTPELIEKVTKQVFSIYINYEQKMAKTYEDQHENYYVIVTTSIKRERLIMAMERYLLPKAGDNRRGHEKKIKQLRQIIEAQFDACQQGFFIDGSAPAKRNRKLASRK